MIETEQQRKPHQGINIKIARQFKDIKQNELADKINLHQSEISKLESQTVIDDDILKNIALALEVPYEFLKNFDLGEHIESYYSQTNTEITMSSGENSEGTTNKIVQHEVVHNYNTTEMLDRLLSEAEEKGSLKEKNRQLEEENQILKNKIN